MLINVKMPTIVGIVCILTLMRRINFVLSGVGHGKSFIASGPVIKTKVDIIAKHMRFCTYYYYCTDEDLDQNLGLWFSWISLYGRLLKASVQCEKKILCAGPFPERDIFLSDILPVVLIWL